MIKEVLLFNTSIGRMDLVKCYLVGILGLLMTSILANVAAWLFVPFAIFILYFYFSAVVARAKDITLDNKLRVVWLVIGLLIPVVSLVVACILLLAPRGWLSKK